MFCGQKSSTEISASQVKILILHKGKFKYVFSLLRFGIIYMSISHDVSDFSSSGLSDPAFGYTSESF